MELTIDQALQQKRKAGFRMLSVFTVPYCRFNLSIKSLFLDKP